MSVEDLLKGTSKSVLVGVGIAALAPLVWAGMKHGARPLAKSLIKQYLELAEKTKELGGEAYEQWNDLLAEIEAERGMNVPAASLATEKASHAS